MNKSILILLFAFSLCCVVNSQDRSDSVIVKPDSVVKIDSTAMFRDSIKIIKKYFDDFEYGQVINFSNRLLVFSSKLPKNDLIEIYKMKGISHFSLAEDQAAQNSFTEILKIDSAFTFDTTKTSPKILTFFSQVKTQYIQQILDREQRTIVRVDTVYVTDPSNTLLMEKGLKNSILRSIFLPGLGHIYKEEYAKGWILTILSAASLGSFIYFTIETNEREDKYLNEIDASLIPARYDDFNRSYTLRNVSIITFAAIWLYSQLDLLLSDYSPDASNKLPSAGFDKDLGFQLKYSFPF